MAKNTPAPAMPKPRVVSTTRTWDMDGTQHPSLTGPLRLLANVPTEVEPDQVDYLVSLPGVVLIDPPEEFLPPSNPVAAKPAATPEES